MEDAIISDANKLTSINHNELQELLSEVTDANNNVNKCNEELEVLGTMLFSLRCSLGEYKEKREHVRRQLSLVLSEL